MARATIDRTNEKFGSKTTIADLAIFSFTSIESRNLTIYQAHDIFQEGWAHELESVEMEYPNWTSATFKDGSRLTVSAWALDPTVEAEAAQERSRLDAI